MSIMQDLEKLLREIAEQLSLSVKTAETHRENIKHKLAFHDAAALVEAARQWVQQAER